MRRTGWLHWSGRRGQGDRGRPRDGRPGDLTEADAVQHYSCRLRRGTNSAKTRSAMGARERLRMDGDKTIGPLALQQLGEALQGGFGIQNRLPFRLYSLVEQLVRMTKEADYLDNAADAVRLAQHAYSSSDKTRLLELAEAWVDLAEKAHENTRRPRRPIILHPLVQKKLGGLPD
jgi:hypothetical protein